MEHNEALTQQTYKSSNYSKQNWEVIGTFSKNPSFEPIEIPVITKNTVQTDPMFADFGGTLNVEVGEALRAGPERSDDIDPEAEKAELLRQHLEEIEKVRAAALAEGKSIGKREAEAGYNQMLQEAQKGIQDIIQDIAKQITEQLNNIEKEAVQLSLSISQKLVGQAVEINPEYIVSTVNAALGHVGSATVRTIRVSPQDMEFIELIGLPNKLIEVDPSWKFEADPTIRSGCVVETSAGEIDFKLDEAWERIKDNVLKAIK